VLRDIPKPPPKVSILKEIIVRAQLQEEVLDILIMPVTLVTTEAVVSLYKIII
jgi:hypothetical protein